MTTPKELARLERQKQLMVYEAFERGEPVLFKTHYNREGFRAVKSELPPKAHNGRSIRFTPEDCLLDAAMSGDVDQAEKLLNDGTSPDCCDVDGITPLHRAAVENHLPIVSLLLSKGANVNIQDKDGWTPLHSAAFTGNWRIVNSLISSGAHPGVLNNDGDFPIDLSSDSKVENILIREMDQLHISEAKLKEIREDKGKKMLADMKQLVLKNGDVNTKLKNGATFLHIAACNGYVDVVSFLLEHPSINTNIPDVDGDTPLHLAVFFTQYDIVTLLVARGANLDARNKLNQKPIIMTEDDVMIRLVSTLQQATPTKVQNLAASNLGGNHYSRAHSISRKSESMRRQQAKDEASKEFSKVGHVAANSSDLS